MVKEYKNICFFKKQKLLNWTINNDRVIILYYVCIQSQIMFIYIFVTHTYRVTMMTRDDDFVDLILSDYHGVHY